MYKKAIDILTMKDVDLDRIAIEIAKSNPSMFVKAFNTLSDKSHVTKINRIGRMFFDEFGEPSEFYHLEISEEILIKIANKYGNKSWLIEYINFVFTKNEPRKVINGIKSIRENEGKEILGLKEAKEISDDIISMASISIFY